MSSPLAASASAGDRFATLTRDATGDRARAEHLLEEATSMYAALGMPKEIVMRHRTSQFAHIFSSDGYSAGYYSYLWSDTLSADAWEAFVEAGGPYDKTVAKRLLDDVFSTGNTIDPAEDYRNFRGRDPGIAALMRKRGFPVPVAQTGGRSSPG